MKNLLAAFVLASTLGLAAAAAWREEPAGPRIVHNVFFALKDNGAEAKAKFVVACKKHLAKDPGAVYFAAGPRAGEF